MQDADLVLEGGGVKGVALVGALRVLMSPPHDYRFRRVAGTSAGAIVAGLLAAGMGPAQMADVMTELDVGRFEDNAGIFRHLRPLGQAQGLVFHNGLFRGDVLHGWIADTLAQLGVRTWGDLRQHDPDSSLPAEQRYRLVVTASDVSRGKLLRLPWDYRALCGVDPDDVPVADAIRASASIPFFFRPVRLRAGAEQTAGHGEILLVDGGLLSNFPVDVFDRVDGAPARWPTLGVKLSARRASTARWNGNPTVLALARSLLGTMASAHDQVHVDDPSVASRTVFVDTTGYRSTDFHLTAADKADLLAGGGKAATAFLDTWDWAGWQRTYRPLTSVAARPPVSPLAPGTSY